MAKPTRNSPSTAKPASPAPQQAQEAPGITWRGVFSLEQREAMIREAAYYQSLQRGHAPGHDLDNWLAAEAELEREMPAEPAAASAEFPADTEIQQSGLRGPEKDDELKREIRRHPQTAIPRIEGIEPEEAPLKA